jgi:hypothetical protein
MVESIFAEQPFAVPVSRRESVWRLQAMAQYTIVNPLF